MSKKRKSAIKRIPVAWKRKRRKLTILFVLVFSVILITGFFAIRNKWFAIGEIDAKKVIPQFYNQSLEVSVGNKKLTVTPLAGNSVKVTQKDIRYIYEGAYKNTDVIQTNYPYKIKEELIFYDKGHPLEFRYKLGNLENFIVEKDAEGNIIFYDKQMAKGQTELNRIFTIPAPFIEDKITKRSFTAVKTVIEGDVLVISIDSTWMAKASYPVILDPTIEINVLNVYSHPSQGQNWEVEFVTKGKADLKIIPQDQATIDDDEFIGLYCDQNIHEPIILTGDVIYYQNWECSGVGKVIHKTLKAGHHTLKFEFSGNEGYAEDWAYNSPGTRARTVTFFAGLYSGTGTAGNPGATSTSFSQFDIELAESNVTIKNAFVILEAQLGGLADDGNIAGYALAFDTCNAPCVPPPNAWTGTNHVSVDDQNSVILAYTDLTGGEYVRLLFNVTSETQLAAYAGGGGSGAYLSAAIGYWFDAATTDTDLINSVKAKLVITYTYDDTSNSITNTAIYPLESNTGTDQGSMRGVATPNNADCVVNSTCILFNYNMDITGFSQKLSQWFEVGGSGDNAGSRDERHYVNIQGDNASSSLFVLEAQQGSVQGNWAEGWYSGVSGFSENTSQQLEHYHYTGTNTDDLFLIGGEVFETYTASASTSTTRTASFPIGVITNGSTTSAQSASTTVYFAETGVTIKRAWFRIIVSGNDTSNPYTLTVSSKVGDNAQSGNLAYYFDAGGTIITEAFKINHVIASGSYAPDSDYDELDDATATSGKTVTLYTTASSTNVRGVSAELMITYTYTDEDYGYLSSHQLFAGQSATAGNDTSETLTTAASVLPESTDAKTIRAAALRASYSVSCSTSTDAMSTAVVNVDADLSSCANAYDGDSDGANSFFEFYKNVTSEMNTYNDRSYSACYTNDGASTANEGAKMNGILIYTYQLDLRPPSDPNLIRIKGNTRIKGGTRLNLEDSKQNL
jgi:hypothetical protein